MVKSGDWFQKKGPSRNKWFRHRLPIYVFSGLVVGGGRNFGPDIRTQLKFEYPPGFTYTKPWKTAVWLVITDTYLHISHVIQHICIFLNEKSYKPERRCRIETMQGSPTS